MVRKVIKGSSTMAEEVGWTVSTLCGVVHAAQRNAVFEYAKGQRIGVIGGGSEPGADGECGRLLREKSELGRYQGGG